MKNDNEEAITKSFFEAIGEGDEENCRRMWLSVILQQYLDALGKFGTGPIQDRARIWFEARGGIKSGFYEVCCYAGIDFEKARERFAELLKTGEAIDFRMVKRDKEDNRTPQNRQRYYRRKDISDELRRKKQRKQAEDFLLRSADNDNFPEYSNDNFAENLNDKLMTQPKEKTHDQ